MMPHEFRRDLAVQRLELMCLVMHAEASLICSPRLSAVPKRSFSSHDSRTRPTEKMKNWFSSLWVQASAAKVLQDTCSYIRSLHREVDDLSERLSELLDAEGVSSAQAAIIRSLLM
ncbi:hypothetical protein BHE74_00049672 [Ensete ventricosum]|nr:hypothetical protein BHE74_00049672 [Ensete ventricosum]